VDEHIEARIYMAPVKLFVRAHVQRVVIVHEMTHVYAMHVCVYVILRRTKRPWCICTCTNKHINTRTHVGYVYHMNRCMCMLCMCGGICVYIRHIMKQKTAVVYMHLHDQTYKHIYTHDVQPPINPPYKAALEAKRGEAYEQQNEATNAKTALDPVEAALDLLHRHK